MRNSITDSVKFQTIFLVQCYTKTDLFSSLLSAQQYFRSFSFTVDVFFDRKQNLKETPAHNMFCLHHNDAYAKPLTTDKCEKFPNSLSTTRSITLLSFLVYLFSL